jgi:hypothetical protein
MSMVGKQVILKLNGTKYDENRALVLEQNEIGLLKIQILEKDNFVQVLTLTQYNLKK